MSTQKSRIRGDESSGTVRDESAVERARDRLAGLLPEEALEDALRGLEPDEITGAGGLLSQLAGRVIETALGAELTEHLGHPSGGVPQGSNVRNGAGSKTLQTDLGPVQIKTPRDRQGTFAPQLVGKRQTRLAGLDEKILGLYAGGMTTRDISAHLAELYGVEIGRDTISTVTDAVLADVEAWRTWPLEAVYPIVYFDALRVSAFAPSSTTSTPCSTSSPRSTRLASSVVATVAFSVEPSHRPSGCFEPSVSIPSATTQHRPLSSIPSSISTARRRSPSGRDMRSIRCSRVRETNSRETADFDVKPACSSTSEPTGSPVRR